MPDDREEKKEIFLGDLFAYSKILDISSNNDDFEKWLEEYHGIKLDEDIYPGYRFFVDCCLRAMIKEFHDREVFNFKRDKKLHRGWFRGVKLDDIPSSCEKTIFLKKLSNNVNPIIKSHNIDQFEMNKGIIDGLIRLAEEIGKRYTIPTITSDQGKSSLNRSVLFRLWDKFLEGSYGLPLIYKLRPVFIERSHNPKYLCIVYPGYLYTLQYVWYKFLGEDIFKKTPLTDLHEADQKYYQEVKPKIEQKRSSSIGLIGFNIDSEDLSETADSTESTEMESPSSYSREFRIESEVNWRCLDKYYQSMEKELKNIEKYLGLQERKTFKTLSPVDQKLLSEHLGIEISRGEKEDKNKTIEDFFLRYPVEVNNDEKSYGFNGVATFIRHLEGAVEIKERHNIKEKIQVRRIKHPSNEGYWYSYALLVGTGSFLADYSGWIVYFNCATDFSGSGNNMRKEAEKYISINKDKINVEEKVIGRNDFKEFLKDQSVSSVFTMVKHQSEISPHSQLDVSRSKNKIEKLLGDVRGKVVEFLLYNWLQENKQTKFDKIKCDRKISGNQIDVFTENENEINIYECKTSVSVEEMDKIIEQLTKKKDLFNDKEKDINLFLTYFREHYGFGNLKKKLEDTEIKIRYSPFEGIFREWDGKSKEDIDRIFKKGKREYFR